MVSNLRAPWSSLLAARLEEHQHKADKTVHEQDVRRRTIANLLAWQLPISSARCKTPAHIGPIPHGTRAPRTVTPFQTRALPFMFHAPSARYFADSSSGAAWAASPGPSGLTTNDQPLTTLRHAPAPTPCWPGFSRLSRFGTPTGTRVLQQAASTGNFWGKERCDIYHGYRLPAGRNQTRTVNADSYACWNYPRAGRTLVVRHAWRKAAEIGSLRRTRRPFQFQRLPDHLRRQNARGGLRRHAPNDRHMHQGKTPHLPL